MYGCYGHRKYLWKTSFLSHFILLIYLSIFNLKALKFIILIQAHDPIKYLVWKHVSNISKTTFIVRNKEGIDIKIHLYENQKISKSFLLRVLYINKNELICKKLHINSRKTKEFLWFFSPWVLLRDGAWLITYWYIIYINCLLANFKHDQENTTFPDRSV